LRPGWHAVTRVGTHKRRVGTRRTPLGVNEVENKVWHRGVHRNQKALQGLTVKLQKGARPGVGKVGCRRPARQK
jgi:hypothetical protein